ncbi:MAG: hypothetical protein V2A76_02630 [Planctomycetota bacterium]
MFSVLLVLPACDGGEDQRHVIADVRVVTDRGAVLNASSARRLGFFNPNEDEREDLFEYQVPSSFQQLAPARFRDVNFKVGEDPGAECYVTVLTGGGEAANINRWRGQMSLEPLDEDALRALPRRDFLETTAPFAEFHGTYSGMEGGGGGEGYALLGLLAQFPQAAVSLKMIGPDATVAAAREDFLAFADSLRIKGAEEGGGSSDPAASLDDSAAHPESIQWDVPAGWELAQGSSSMRLMTLKVTARPGAECWVTVLRGLAGGVSGNLNRWRREMGQPPLTEEELAALPTLKVLGAEAPFLEVTGPEGADGTSRCLLGVIAELSGNGVFIKMVGSREDLAAEREQFAAFCRSLRV